MYCVQEKCCRLEDRVAPRWSLSQFVAFPASLYTSGLLARHPNQRWKSCQFLVDHPNCQYINQKLNIARGEKHTSCFFNSWSLLLERLDKFEKVENDIFLIAKKARKVYKSRDIIWDHLGSLGLSPSSHTWGTPSKSQNHQGGHEGRTRSGTCRTWVQ